VARWFAAVVVLFIVLCAAPLKAAAPVISDRSDLDTTAGVWTARMPEGSRLELRGVDASIEVTTSADEQVSVTISGESLPRLELITHDQGYTICTMYPSPNPRKQNSCVPGKESRLDEGFKAAMPAVHFKVSLPANVHLTGSVARGSISATAGPGPTDFNLKTILGDLSIVDLGGRHLRAEVVRGNLDASIAASEFERIVNLKNMNGPVRVAIPNVPIRYQLNPAHRVRTNLKLAEPVASMITGSFESANGKLLYLHLDAGVLLGYIELRRGKI
jgi:hypothetical protein